MDKEKLMEFIDLQIAKYDKMASDSMGTDMTTYMHLNGISSGLWLVKTQLELSSN